MAMALGYKNLKQTEIDRFYSPKYFGSQMSRQEILFQENLRVLMDITKTVLRDSPKKSINNIIAN